MLGISRCRVFPDEMAIQVNIRATRSHADFTRDGVDMAVRFGPGTWVGLRSIKLYDEELIPVCSPAFRDGRLPRAPDDLLKVPLLHSERQSWSIWFEGVGVVDDARRTLVRFHRVRDHRPRIAASLSVVACA